MTGICVFIVVLLVFPNAIWHNGAVRLVSAWSSASTLNYDVVLKIVLLVAAFGAYFYYDAGNCHKRTVSYVLAVLSAGALVLFVLNHEAASLGWAVPILTLL